MTDPAISGSCLCGLVRFEVDPPFQIMAHCHCSRCRKSTGTGHATNLTAGPGQLRWLSGEDAIGRYELPTAQSYGKWFCSTCGSPVPRLRRDGRLYIVPAGSLDADPGVRPSHRIFWSSRAPWSCEGDALPTHDAYPEVWTTQLAPQKR